MECDDGRDHEMKLERIDFADCVWIYVGKKIVLVLLA